MTILPQISVEYNCRECSIHVYVQQTSFENKIFGQNSNHQISLEEEDITGSLINRPFQFVLCTKYLSTLRDCAPLMPPNRPNGDGACVSQCPDTPAHHQNHHRPTEARVEQIDQSQSGIWSRDRNRPMRDEERTREQLSANPFCRLKGEIRLFISSCSAVTCRGNGDGWIQSFWKMKKGPSCQLLSDWNLDIKKD